MNQICCPIRENAINKPECEAVISPEYRLSYKRLDHLVTHTSIALSDYNIRAGQRVVIFGYNCVEYIVFIFALLRLRALVCPLSVRFPSSSVLEILRSIDCKTLLLQSDLDQEPGNNLTLIRFNAVINTDKACYIQQPPIRHSNLIDPEQDATILFTTGTIGPAKAVLHSYGNHWFSALGSNSNIRIDSGDRWLLSLGLWHIGGFSIPFRCFIAGGTVVVTPRQKVTNRILHDYKITHISLVPTQLRRLMQDKEYTNGLSCCKSILLGGDIIPDPLIKRAITSNLAVHTTYGSTELASQVTTTEKAATVESLFSSGKVLKFRELKIARNEEILLKGKTLFRGYLKNGELVSPLDKNGWFHSGDFGVMDENGNLSIIGRKDNMFISGGENIQPEEIEQILLGFEFISQAIIVPVPDLGFGFRPVGFIKTVNSERIDTHTLVRELEMSLPRFKIPKIFYEWPNIPESYSSPMSQELENVTFQGPTSSSLRGINVRSSMWANNKINRNYFMMLAQKFQNK